MSGSNDKKEVFSTGDTFKILINFKLLDLKIEGVNFGVGIYSEDDTYILGYNTQMDDFSVKKDKKGELCLEFKTLPLLRGNYYINVSCFSNEDSKHLDFKPKCKYFKVFSSGKAIKYRGFLSIDHEWYC